MLSVKIIPFLDKFEDFLKEKEFKFQENTKNNLFYSKETEDFYIMYSPLSQELIYWIIQDVNGGKTEDSLEDNFNKAQKDFESLCWEFYLKYGKTTENILGSYLSTKTFNIKRNFQNQTRETAPALINNYSQMVEKYKKMPGMESANYLDYFYKKVTEPI